MYIAAQFAKLLLKNVLQMNTYLKYQSPAIQFMAFMGLASGFFLINFVLSTIFFPDIAQVLNGEIENINPKIITQFKLANALGAIVSFLIPSLLFGYFSDEKPLLYLGLKKVISSKIIFFLFLLILSIQFIASWLGEWNSHINFGSLQEQIEKTEAIYSKAFEVMLQMNNWGDVLLNILLMALLPAIAEELFFRASLQKVIQRWSNKSWFAVLISSLVFALLHGTFFKFIPILLLGVMLGTLYHFTKNIWYNIFIHFFNNALAVLAVYYANKSDLIKSFSDDKMKVSIIAAIISIVVSVAILMYIKKITITESAEVDDNDDIVI
jgi:membrane protease YdiL (CAAX protease family)